MSAKIKHRRRIIRFLVVLAVITCCLWLTAHFSAQQLSWKPSIHLGLPDDAWEYYVPNNNPMTPAKMELDRKLFFYARQSDGGSVSCSSWHDPKLAFTDCRAVSEGGRGRLGPRNTPMAPSAMFNSAHNHAQSSPVSARQSSLERAVADTQQTLAQDLDPELPRLPFANWFRQIAGPGAGVIWQVSECGERGEDSLNAAGDIRACVEANAMLPDGRRVILMTAVGTFKRGVIGAPAFQFGVIEQDGELRTIRRLRDLQKQLLAPGNLTNRPSVKLPELNMPEVRLSANNTPVELAPAWGWDVFDRTTAIEEPPPAPPRAWLTLSEAEKENQDASEEPGRPAVGGEVTSLGDVAWGDVIKKAQPRYPAQAKRVNASGPVNVHITISETGRVIEAKATSGHPLLRDAAVTAARQWVFKPAILNGVPVKTETVLVFVFTVPK